MLYSGLEHGRFGAPLLVMLVVPFGAAGAIVGHWVMGYELTMISMVALIALMGILVNDSIILLDEISTRKRQNQTWEMATIGGFIRRCF